jgi:DNA-binding PadR family transcriptional regulator
MTAVLAEFLSARDDWHYGYNISRSTGLKSGTLYPLLIRLAEHGLLETAWSTSEEGKPPRHMYRLTGHGLRYAIEQSAADARPALKIALGEASTV